MNVSKLIGEDGDHLRWWCPGCNSNHVVPVGIQPQDWGFNGDVTAPTLTPSVLVHGHLTLINGDLEGDALLAESNKRMTPTCHTFIRDGHIEYLPDCTHELAGQTVPMAPVQI